MKVLHIISGDLWAGAEVQAFTLMKTLVPQCDVMAVVMNEGRLSEELRAAGVATEIINESRVSSLGILIKLRRIMRTFHPDVIHTHRQKENVLGSVANLLTLRNVSVRTVHGSSEFQLHGFKKSLRTIDNLVGRYLQKGVIAVSDSLSEELTRIFGANKVVVIANGIDVASLNQHAEKIPLSENSDAYWHIGLVGRVEPVKRVDLFLKIASAMLDDRPAEKPLMFHIIGDGSLKAQLEEETRKLNLDSRVTFHGHRNDIPSCIFSLNALVMCSDHEGSPMTALEALALGKPIIAHKVGGLVDILEQRPEFLVAGQDPSAYRQALLSALTEPVFKQVQLPEAFTAKKNSETTLGLYRRLLGEAV